MKLRFIGFLALFWGSLLGAREFTVLVYNVENLFDVDGAAEYADYRQGAWGGANPYTPAQFLTKLRHIGETLQAVNDGAGPEVILFQEIELDRTPYSRFASPAAFLDAYAGTTVEAMLTSEFNYEVSRLPATWFLLKHLADIGLGVYEVASPDPARLESVTAQENVVFSKFPITWVRQRPLYQARELQVVGLDVDGHELIVMNNHWKSGASNASTEPIRVQNALVVRAELEAILLENPSADVLLGGDLNTYYNHKSVFPELPMTAIKDILGSSTDEVAHAAGTNRGLYNLWGELPVEERGSEVYRGSWGTLMQLLVTRGLYDESGIQYVDNSFYRLILPGRNAERRWNVPISWKQYGDGAGFSDHLPVGARFRVVGPGSTQRMMPLTRPTTEAVEPAERLVVPFERLDRRAVARADSLEGLSPSEIGQRFGELFALRGTLENGARQVRVGGITYGLYTPDPALRERLVAMGDGAELRSYAMFGMFRGQLQWVIESAIWVQP